ncbi:MAG TPA: PLP-dependent aminotransferase family protein [Solirubrobacterales bacterium]|nr:PLP-dependent aminotransferase family protein [Solirubrobacterales bacterium]
MSTHLSSSAAARRGRHDDSLTRIARLLRGWDGRAEATLPERLAAAIIELIDQGELAAGFKLPSERRLAEALAISRGTVTAAYGELKTEGWLDSRVGSGSKVMSVKGRPAADRTRVGGRLATVGASGVPLDLTSGALPGLELTAELAARAMRDRLPGLLTGDGYQPQGLPELRLAVADYYGKLGARTDPEQIAITTGSQQALQLLADAFIAPGDTVLVEESTYRGAIEVYHSHGAKLVPIPTGSDGPDPEALRRLVERLRPRVVYMLPTAHNPTGYVVPPLKAAAIAAVLRDSEAMFFEDGTPADLVLDRSRPPIPIGAGIPPERWIAIGSISKLFWGGLRVGWIRAVAGATQRLTRIKTAADLGTSLVGQAVATECLGAAEEARAQRREELLAGLDGAEALLRELAPEWEWERPQGGSALWVRIPGADTKALAEVGRRNGVAVIPGAFFSPVDGLGDRIRIPFWGDGGELRAGLEVLVAAQS